MSNLIQSFIRNPISVRFLIVVLSSFLLIAVVLFLIIKYSDFILNVLLPRRASIYQIEEKIADVARKRKITEQYSLFSRERLLKANITTEPSIFFARVFLIYIGILIVLFAGLRPDFMFGISLFIIYTGIFFAFYVAVLKYKTVQFEEKIMHELPDVTYQLLSVLSRSSKSSIQDALEELTQRYPNFVISKAFKMSLKGMDRHEDTEKALKRALSVVSIPKFVELVNMLIQYSNIGNPTAISRIFHMYVGSVFLNIQAIDEAETTIKHFTGVAVFISLMAVVGIFNMAKRIPALVVNSNMSYIYSASSIVSVIGIYIPVLFIIAGIIALMLEIVHVKEKVMDI